MSSRQIKPYSVTFFLLIFFFTGIVYAQTYQYPSPERVETLLEEIKGCKALLEEAESSLKVMNADPESVTLKEYLDTQKLLKVAESCITKRRKELDKLREEYPGWFNGTGTVSSLKRNKEIEGEDVEKNWIRIDIVMRELRESFDEVNKPSDHE